ncbi:MAG: hypothetical protein AAF990_15890 [Bacteroidota bacterium]
MKKTFVIRKIAYHYSDEYFYVHTMGGIENIYESEEAAKKELIRLEREELERLDLGDTEQLSGCSHKFMKEAKTFKYLFKQKFGKDLVKVDEYGNIFCDRGTYLPKGLSDKDLMHIRDTLDLKFHELSEYEGDPHFYGIWLCKQGAFHTFNGAPYFYNSFAEALKEAHEQLRHFLINQKWQGTLSSLSDQPIILRSLINSSDKISYDDENKELSTKYLSEKDGIALNELLREKVMEIKQIPLSEVEGIDHWTYTEM